MAKYAGWLLAGLVGVALITAPPAMAHEEEAAEEDTGPWSGSITAGYLASAGNSENTNLNAALEVAYTAGLWTHAFNALAVKAVQEEDTTAEAYAWGWRSERSISEFNFLVGRLSWRKDRFSSYETQFSQTAGIGRRLLDADRHKLDAEIGAGARQSELIDGTTENELIIRAGLDYAWTISDTTEFRETFKVEGGQENTYIESITALSAQLVGQLALVASYTVRHNTEVLPGTEKTDTWTALSLEYLF